MRSSWLFVPLLLAASNCRSDVASAPKTSDDLRLVDGPGLMAEVHRQEARVVIVNFWATWCAPCKEEFPTFVKVGRKYRDKGVELLFVSMDFPEERRNALTFLREQNAPLPSWARRGKDHEFITAVHPRWSGALPATIIYAQNNTRYFWEGKVDEGTLTQALETLLALESAQP